MKYLQVYSFNRLLFSPSKTALRCFSSRDGATVSKEQVGKFNEQAKHWWDITGPVAPLHHLNNVRVPFIRESVLNNRSQPFSGPRSDNKQGPHPLKGCRLIDVGCGAGILSEALARIGADTTGLDAGEQLIAVAQQHAALDPSLSDNLRYVNVAVEEHVKQHTAHYDAVVCSEVIEHVNDPGFFVEQLAKLVKPGGSLVFTTIGRNLLSGFLAIFMAEYVIRAIPRGTHQYSMLMPAGDLEKMLKSNNCDVRKTQGFMIWPGGKWSHFPTTAVFYAMHAVKSS